MPTLKLDVDQETYGLLAEQAVTERRPIDWQAEIALRRAFGLPFPAPAPSRTTDRTAPAEPASAVMVEA